MFHETPASPPCIASGQNRIHLTVFYAWVLKIRFRRRIFLHRNRVIDPGRFDNARQAAAFAGLGPRQHESGSSIKGKPRMSKEVGPTFAQGALHACHGDVYRADWEQRFRERRLAAGKPPKLIIGAMMRKLVHVAFGVLKSGKSFDPALQHA